MSKMSQLHAELSEQAYELGYESIEDAEAHGVKIQYNADGTATLVPFLTEAEQEQAEQAVKDEMLDKIDEAIGYIRFYDHKDSEEHINNLLAVEEYINNN